MFIEYRKCRLYPATILLTSMIGSLFSPVYAEEKSHEQEFIITAYYSPLPNQCCYFRGNYEEEIIFNGKGTHGADGTAVYPGMIAAPSTYAFGTVIRLPGIGVGTVHDRGSRIVEWGNNVHRIDIWMGAGEEGLARAMAWGVRSVKGTVYPVGAVDTPKEEFSLDVFSKDSASLHSLPKTDTTQLLTQATFGDQEYSVRTLQSTLKDLGYFKDSITGTFGPVTQSALSTLLRDYGLPGDGTKVEPLTSAVLTEASALTVKNLPDVPTSLELNSEKNVRQLQKLLRFLGLYRGRTNGVFDQSLREAIIALQLKKGLIVDAIDANAGRVGPGTKAAILTSWKAKIVLSRAKSVVLKTQVATKARSEGIPTQVLAKGDTGREVRLLQVFLHQKGYLARKDVTGNFGQKTHDALVQYQLVSKIVASDKVHGAGVFGPTTKQKMAKDLVEDTWKKVLANGMKTL